MAARGPAVRSGTLVLHTLKRIKERPRTANLVAWDSPMVGPRPSLLIMEKP